NADEAIVRIHRIREHAPKLEIGDLLLELRNVGADRSERRIVALGACEIEELGAVVQALVEQDQCADDLIELFLFAAQILRALRIVPDVRVLELAGDDFEALALRFEVKDISAA